MKKQKKSNYSFLVIFSFLALTAFFVMLGTINNIIFSKQKVLSGVSEKFYSPRDFVKTNSDPLIIKSADYYKSFVRNYNPSFGSGELAIIFFGDFTDSLSRDIWNRLIVEKEKTNFTLFWKNFPSSINNNSRNTAISAICAGAQGKFFEFANLMFQNQENLSAGNLRIFAQESGLDMDLFSSCFEDEKMLQLTGIDLEDGQNLMIDKSPYLFVGNSRIESSKVGELEKIFEIEK
jgi:hypothetical protein